MNTLNKRNANGSINVSGENNNYGVPVSPLHPLFESQIEDNILPHVKLLNKKGYLPYESCEGHTKEDPPYITICFGDYDNMIKFTQFINHFSFFVTCTIEDDISQFGLTTENLTTSLNNMFMRNYDNYWFVIIKSERMLFIFYIILKLVPHYEHLN